MDEMMKQVEEMRKTRGWDKTDTPAILAKSIVVEAAELLECFQFDEEHFDKEAVKGEIADVLMYTVSLAHDLGWDYRDVVIEKIKNVEEKYPDVRK